MYIFSNMVTWITTTHSAFCFNLFCNLKKKKIGRIAVTCTAVFNWSSWMTTCLGKIVYSVYCACLSQTFINLCVFFPFWFWGWDVGFDCINSWPVPFYLPSKMGSILNVDPYWEGIRKCIAAFLKSVSLLTPLLCQVTIEVSVSPWLFLYLLYALPWRVFEVGYDTNVIRRRKRRFSI